MSLYNFFFPQQATAEHLQSLTRNQAKRRRQDARKAEYQDKRLAELEQDLGYVALVLASLLQKVDERGVLSRDEVREAMASLDEIDGVKDGRLDINILRGLNA